MRREPKAADTGAHRAACTTISARTATGCIEYQGVLVGDVSLCGSGELAIVVCKAFQNRHIGRRCIREMLKLAQEKGMDTVKANIYALNTQSQRIFLSAGFVKTDGEWYEYRLPRRGVPYALAAAGRACRKRAFRPKQYDRRKSMSESSNLTRAAAPWVAAGLAIAIVAARGIAGKKKDKKQEDRKQ